MKSQINQDVLAFNKSTLVELNDQQMADVDSGFSSTVCISSLNCAAAAAAVSSGACIVGAAVVGVTAGIVVATAQ